MRDATRITPIAMLLFGGALQAQCPSYRISIFQNQSSRTEIKVCAKVDKKRQAIGIQTVHLYKHWLRFTASPNLAVLIKLLRAEVERLLLAKADEPAAAIWDQAGVIRDLVGKLLREEAGPRGA